MIIGCTNCKAQYSLSIEEIQNLNSSVFKCKKCKKLIKITRCPHCKSYYSITYTKATKDKYQINCLKCKQSFSADFPNNIDEKTNYNLPQKEETNKKATVLKTKEESGIKKKLFENLGLQEKTVLSTKKPAKRFKKNPALNGIKKQNDFNIQELLAIGAEAITFSKLLVSSLGVVSIVFFLFIYNSLTNLLFSGGPSALHPYINSFLNLIQLALIFFMFTLVSAAISKITIDNMKNPLMSAHAGITQFILQSIPSMALVNFSILAIINLLLILFGEIPIIGPIFFSLLFLPIYIISILIVVVISIGFWFYPPIVAAIQPGVMNNIREFISFIRRQNFRLIYIIPIMAIITSLIFSVLYFFHYGSLSITMLISNTILSEDGVKIFAAIPTPLLQISDMSMFGSHSGLFRSFVSDLILTHHIGGIIIGVVFSAISLFLLSLFISIVGTLSAHVFIMIEKGVDSDDSNKIRLLTILILFLITLFLFKKVFL